MFSGHMSSCFVFVFGFVHTARFGLSFLFCFWRTQLTVCAPADLFLSKIGSVPSISSHFLSCLLQLSVSFIPLFILLSFVFFICPRPPSPSSARPPFFSPTFLILAVWLFKAFSGSFRPVCITLHHQLWLLRLANEFFVFPSAISVVLSPSARFVSFIFPLDLCDEVFAQKHAGNLLHFQSVWT